MWLANEEWPGNPAYNASFRWKLKGSLDLPALQRCVNEIVARHEVLRATFACVDGIVHQVISPSLRLLIPVTDLRQVAPASLDAEVEKMCASEASRSFSLERGPLIRVGLLRTEESQYVLMLTLHHIICDGWSVGVFMRELKRLYTCIAEGRPADLRPLAIQFPDYVIWRNDRAEEVRDQELSYWRQKLQGYRRFRLTPDFADRSERTVGSTIVSRLLPRAVTNALKKFGDEHSGTMFGTTFAACVALLHRQTGETDIAMWTPLAGRNQTEVEGLIGLFVSEVVLRVDASGDPSFADLTARVRDSLWEALAHQTVAFEDVIDALPDGDRPRHGPFCSINFVCQRAFGGSVSSEFDFPGIEVAPIPSRSPGALYDLNFFLVEREDGWRLSLEYKTSLYSSATGDLLIDQFCRILDEVASNPDMRLSKLLASAGEVAVIEEAPSAPAAEEGSDVPERKFESEEEAAESFGLPASVSQLRFWRLWRIRPDSAAFNMPAAVRISGRLSIGILEDSLREIIGRHEILRTTFKEVDDDLTQIISSRADCGVHFSDLRDLSGDADVNLNKLLHEEAHALFDLERGPLARVRLVRLGEDEHVLIITVHHIISDGWSQSILQRELWTTYEALAGGRRPDLPPLPIQYADFAVWQREWMSSDEAGQHREYWTKTLAGPLPVLDFPTDHPPGQRPSVRGAVERLRLSEDLVQRLKNQSRAAHVTMYMLTLAAFAMLLERHTAQHDLTIGSPSANRNSQTETMIGPFSGPIALRLNLAGDPTFNEVLAHASRVTMDALDHAAYPFESIIAQLRMRSIQGRNPLFQFYFLYQAAFLQRREVPGLVIAPIQTISVGNPFELQLAVIERNDGLWLNLEYDQGLFEPASIRNILAYYQFVLEEIAASLDKRISDLRPPVGARSASAATMASVRSEDFVGPRNPVEAKLAAMWEKLFDLPQVGVRDDFFDLGGHSLLAASLISMIEKEFAAKIDLSNLLVSRTIEQLARTVTGTDENPHSSLIPLRTMGTKTPLFCVHGGGGHVLGYEELAKALPGDQPVYGLASPELDGAQKAMTVPELARLYNSEIRRVRPHGPYRLCGYSFGGVVALEMAVQLVEEGEDVPVLVMLDTGNSGYYRHLPLQDWIRFWGVRIFDRGRRYYRRLADRKVDVALSSAFYFVRKNVRLQLWKLAQRVFRIANRPMPSQLRDNVTMFKAVARSYEPRPLPVQIILFRVEERDPEYSLNKSLGWELVASKGVSVHYVPGDHLSFMRQPHVGQVAKQLSDYLT